jgi:hypothetical protein
VYGSSGLRCTLTLTAQLLLVHHSAGALMCDIRYPDATDSDVLRFEFLVQLVP